MRRRWIQVDGQLVDADAYALPQRADYHVMPDIQPYVSMADGSIITSRSRHREHLRQHNCVEVGNDSSLYRRPPPIQPPPGLKDAIIRAVNQVEERDRQRRRH